VKNTVAWNQEVTKNSLQREVPAVSEATFLKDQKRKADLNDPVGHFGETMAIGSDKVRSAVDHQKRDTGYGHQKGQSF
jgi:hypothetical protein